MRMLTLAAMLAFTLAAGAAVACPAHETTAQNDGNVVASNNGQSEGAPMTRIPPAGQQQGG